MEAKKAQAKATVQSNTLVDLFQKKAAPGHAGSAERWEADQPRGGGAEEFKADSPTFEYTLGVDVVVKKEKAGEESSVSDAAADEGEDIS